MKTQTDEANTATWLEASGRESIRAYVESYTPTLTICESASPSRDLYKVLREVSVWFSDLSSGSLEPELNLELQAWDVLSDEALEIFEQDLE